MKKHTILYLLCFNFLSCSLFAQTPKNDEPNAVNYSTSSYNTAIFNAVYSKRYFDSTYTPTKAEIDLAERALSRELSKLNKPLIHQDPRQPIHRTLLRYNRQYFGYFNEKGQKILYINALHRDKSDSYMDSFLTKKIIFPFGGSHFWNISYNLVENKLFEFNVNTKEVEIETKSEIETEEEKDQTVVE